LLPPAVFSCSDINEVEEELEEEEEEPQSLWGHFVDRMHGGRRGRHHEGRPKHGGRGGRHHGGKHQRGPSPMEDDEEESFYGMPPRPQRGPRVQSEREQSQGHHGRHGGKHGHHGSRHHRVGKVLCALVHVAAVALFAGHFYFIYQLKKAQVAEEKICGKKECGWRKWKCGGKKSAFQQPVVA